MDIREHRSFNARVRVAVITVGHADLTEGDTSQVVPLFTLPAGAQCLGKPEVALGTPFSGGGNNACAVKVGSAGDDDALLATADLFAAATAGQASTQTAGLAPTKRFAAETVINGTFTCAAGILSGFTAGACTIRQLYCLPDNT